MTNQDFIYKNVWTGGTFDHFHSGHEALMNKAFEVSGFVTIGITTNELVKDKKYSEFIQPLEQRMKIMGDYLARKFGPERYKFVINDDVYTKAVLSPSLEANIICFKTEHHGDRINRLRIDKGLKPLDLVMAPSGSDNPSSTEVRRSLYFEKYGRDLYNDDSRCIPKVDRI